MHFVIHGAGLRLLGSETDFVIQHMCCPGAQILNHDMGSSANTSCMLTVNRLVVCIRQQCMPRARVNICVKSSCS